MKTGRAVDPAVKARVAGLLAAGVTVSEVARLLGLDRGTVRKYRPADDAAAAAPAPEPPADPLAAAEEQHARRRSLLLEREALRDVAGEKAFRTYLADLIRAAAPRVPAPPPYRPAAADPAATEESLVLLLSDWHAYEVVKRERVLDLNEYNADVCGRRVWRIGHAVRSIAGKLRKGGWRLPRLVIAANGDMISGTIHEVERHQDAPNVMQAAFGCGMLLAQLVRDLSAVFPAVDVVGTCGNHGRLPDARRVQQKDPSRSWDWAIYKFAELALRDCKNVRFDLPDTYAAVYEVEGWRFLQTHGHDVKSWQSIPFYGISRMATGVNAIRSAVGKPIQYFLISHFHNPSSITAPGGEYFVNGSLIGGTEYAVNSLGRADRPCQLLLGVHKDNGVTHRWPLYADGPGPSGTYDPRPWGAAPTAGDHS